jgi:hypothetical protein
MRDRPDASLAMPEADPSSVHALPAEARGRLTLDDMARHVTALRVAVPPGTAALSVTFDHAPRHPGAGDIPHQLSISVIGPSGPRGTRHNHLDQSVRIGAASASPGYRPGPLEPGVWTVEIDVHRILPPGGIDWRVTARAAVDGADPVAPGAASPDVPGQRPGWFRGDLHRHTDHSDAVWTPAAMVADARARGYDFAALTDHNTVSALPFVRAAAGAGLLILPGQELTGFHGHALALGPGSGMGRQHDWRIRDGQTMAARAAEVQAAGDLFVIAHPMSAGHPFCTGCFWAHPEVMPGPARLVEVWNGPWGTEPKNPLGLDLFHGWLNAGNRLVATAGSDDHGRHGPDARPGHVLVHAAALSVAAILAGLRAGHVILTGGPRLSVAARTMDGGLRLPGDVIPVASGLDVVWQGAAPGGSVRLVTGRRGEGGTRIAWTGSAPAASGDDGAVHVPADALSGADWAMVELRAPDGTPEAIANPVFVGDWPGS